jgi:hypothetical protein
MKNASQNSKHVMALFINIKNHAKVYVAVSSPKCRAKS